LRWHRASPYDPRLAALVDLAFLPALGIAFGLAMLRAHNWRNVRFIGLLTILFVANLLFHLDNLALVAEGSLWGRTIAVDLLLLMVAIIGGRIIPAFTTGAVRWPSPDARPRSRPILEFLSIGLLLAVNAADLAAPETALLAAVSGAAALAHLLRLAQWKGWRTLDRPILWVLHLGYLWIPIGLGLKATWLAWNPYFASTFLHADHGRPRYDDPGRHVAGRAWPYRPAAAGPSARHHGLWTRNCGRSQPNHHWRFSRFPRHCADLDRVLLGGRFPAPGTLRHSPIETRSRDWTSAGLRPIRSIVNT
jgi:hypothetical protein